jgi:N-acetylneuraminic acid mutarotase
MLEDRRVPTAVAVPSGLVSWWTANNTGADVMGLNNATLYNGTTYAAGEVGQAFSFDGSSTRVEVADSTSLAFAASLTIEGWIKLNSYPASGSSTAIVFRGDDRGGLDPYSLTIQSTGRMSFQVTNQNNSGTSITAPIALGQFIHVAATLDDATGTMRLYENGAIVAQTVTTVRPFGALDPTQNPGFGIGNANGTSPSSFNIPFDGLIDELSMYNRALTPGEVLGIFKAGSDGKVASPIAVDYPSVIEGAAGTTTPETFTITRTGSLSGSLAVNWTTADDTAKAGTDYAAAAGTVTFADGQATQTVQVTVKGNDIPEPNKTFHLVVNPTGGPAVMGVGTIVDDDVGISVADATAKEGDAGIGQSLGAFVPQSANGGLNRSTAMAWGPDGNLYVGSLNTNQVLRYDGTTGAFLGTFIDAGTSLDKDSPFMQGLQFRPDGKLYVLSRNTAEVQRFDALTGAFIDDFIPAGSNGLNGAKGMTVGPDGNWYISSGGTNQILSYSGTTGAYLGVFAAAGTSGLSNPRALTFGPDGNLYVASSGSNAILRYNGKTGAFIDAFVPSGTGGLAAPAELIFSGTSLYVASQNSNEVIRYDAQTGAFLDKPVTAGFGGLDAPIGLLFDSNNNLLVGSNLEILRYGPRSQAAFAVHLSIPSATPVTVHYQTGDGSAVAGRDYTVNSGTLTFAPGETSKIITVQTLVDSAGEPTPVFTMNLSNPTGGTVTDGQAAGMIVDSNVTPVNIAVASTHILLGSTATITLTVKDAAGNSLSGLPFTVGLGNGTGNGTFSSVTDNHDGTYTATLTATAPGPIAVDAFLYGQTIASNEPTITVVPTTQLIIANLGSANMTAGDTVNFTVTAEDSNGLVLPGYTGTVHLASKDPAAVLPGDYTFTSADHGTHTFSATLNTAGAQSLSAIDTTTAFVTGELSPILVKPATAGTWFPAAHMTSPRNLFQATLLLNGNVLLTGGVDSNHNYLSSAELYDPATNTWSSAGSMSIPRDNHTATLLQNGKVLIVGGQSSGGTDASSAELYDPATNSWSSAGSLTTARDTQTATLLGNGQVLITGGIDDNFNVLSSAELYDPMKNSWSTASPMATPRVFHTATLLGNGQVLVTGGIDDNFDALASTELYDPATNSWSAAAHMADKRFLHTTTLLGNGLVLAAGGLDDSDVLASAELYDTTNNTWSSAGSMASAREEHTATLLNSGLVLLAGGDGDGGSALPSAELYDPLGNTWSGTGSMATARGDQTATLLNNGMVLIAGGGAAKVLSSAELYFPAQASPSQSTVTVSPASIPLGGTAKITLTANDFAGKPLTSGGLRVSFGLGAGTGNGAFANLTDNNDGTYSAIFTSSAAGPISITATLSGQPLTSTLPTITVAAAKYVITNLSTTSVAAGGTVTFTVNAEDSSGNPIPNYDGTVQLTSTDSHATSGGKSLPVSYTFTASDSGVHTFTVALAAPGSQTITVTNQVANSLTVTTSPITVNAGPFSQFVVSAPAGATIPAGSPFLVTAQAADSFGNPVTNYSGPTSVTVSASPPDPQSQFPITVNLNGSGFGFFLANLKTAGTYTLTATAGAFTGTSSSLTITPAAPSYFTVSAPTAATAGNPVNVAVTAYDHYGNIATGYAGTVNLSSTDPAANLGGYTFTTGTGKDNGVHTFPITLKTAGSQTITVSDATSTNPTITGTSSPITTRGLVVTGLTPTATGFTVNFSEPFAMADVNLYGGSQASPLQDVTLVGASSGPVNGSFVVDPSGMSATFKASSIFLSTFFQSSVLPDDTWTATLVSGTGTGATAHGFFDALNAPLDGGNNAGHDNYTTTFTTANGTKEALSIPDFARGPDGANAIKVPNDSAKGIPVTLANVPAASGVTDAVFTLSYNPTLLTPTGAGTGDSSGTGSTFTMGTPVSADATHSTVTFTWHNAAAQSGNVVLGDILANVPNSAVNEYKGKEILGLSAIKVNNADFTGVWANGLHMNAYFGDVTGDGKISGLDVATAAAVASGSSEGLSAFRLIDPALVGDIAGDASIDATAVSDLASFTSNLPTPQIPAIPTGLTITPGGPDPTLSLGEGGRISNPSYSGIVSVSVMLDDPHPAGSRGMEEAVLALTYDPKVLTVSSSDITLGSIPGLGSNWHLVSVVDQATGQIGIDLYSTTAISAAQAGSLVNIAFHVVPGAAVPATSVQLVSAVTPNGRYFSTEVADDQGQYVLSPGVDQLIIQNGWLNRPVRATHAAQRSK